MRFKRENPKRQKWNRLGLIISSCYLLLTVIVQQVATSKFESQLTKNNIVYLRKIVKPSPLNIILWNVVVETETGYYLGDYSFFDSQPISFDFYPRNDHLIKNISNEKVIKQLQWISEGYWLITTKEGVLFLNDIRFGLISTDRNNPEFSFSYELIEENNHVQALEVANKRKGRAKELLTSLWKRIKGN